MIPTARLRMIIADAEAATVTPWYLGVCREVLALRERRDKVLALHEPASPEMPYCLGCDAESSTFNTPWPCPTIRALGVTEEADR